MAFKMNRPLKMNGPKKSGLKLGRNKTIIGNELNADTTGFFYNSKMGPMQMVNPSALKQMEEEVDPDAPGTPGEPGYEPPVRREDLDEEGKRIFDKHAGKKRTIAGQYIIAEGGEFWYDTGGDDQIYIEDPDGIVAANTSGEYVDDVDFLFEQTEDGYYKVTGVADVSEGGEFEKGVPGTYPQE